MPMSCDCRTPHCAAAPDMLKALQWIADRAAVEEMRSLNPASAGEYAPLEAALSAIGDIAIVARNMIAEAKGRKDP